MSSESNATIIAAIITGISSLAAVLIPLFVKRKRKKDSTQKNNSPEKATNGFRTEKVSKLNYGINKDGFYGRTKEIRTTRNLFIDHNKRLVTLTGFGGFGKTSLAKEIGQTMSELYPGGVWFVSFVESSTIEGMAKEVYDSFGLDSSSAQFENGVEAVIDLLKSREKSFLILDNFEHILHHAEITVKQWMQDLPNIDFLVTSRFALNISDEQQVNIGPIELLDKNEVNYDKLKNNAAVKLFVDRAKQIDLDYTLSELNAPIINQICNEVQGIPLAIEIASGYINISEQEILNSLKENLNLKNKKRDSSDRHETLEKVIEWSYQLLKPIEQDVFLQLSIFKDGFDLAGAKSVVDLSNFPGEMNLVEVLTNLQDKSLLFQDKSSSHKRYSMLVSVERYAEEKLSEVKTDSFIEVLTTRWSNYFIELLKAQTNKANTAAHNVQDLISPDIENIFSVQDTCLDQGEFNKAAEIILLVSSHLSIKGPALLRVPRLQKSFDSLETGHPLKGTLSLELAKAYVDRGELNEAEQFAQIAYDTFKKDEDLNSLSDALLVIGSVLKSRGFFQLSLEYRKEALKVALNNHPDRHFSTYYMWIATSYERLGHFDKSDENFKMASDLAKEQNQKIQLSIINSNWSLAKWHQGKPKEALRLNKKAQKLGLEVNNLKWKPAFMTNEALILSDLGRFSDAIDTCVKADELHKIQGTRHWAAVNFGSWGRALLRRGLHDDSNEARELLQRALKVSRELYWPDNISMTLQDLAQMDFKEGKFQESFSHLLEAIALERRMGLLKEYRHFSKLVLMSLVARELELTDIQWECLSQARSLQSHLKINEGYGVSHVADESKILSNEILKWESEVGSENNLLLPPPKLGNLELEPKFSLKLLDKIQSSFQFSSYGYPWYDLENILEKKGQKSIRLFGYGSLLNKFSAQQTINKDSVNQYKPAVAFGIRRLLDYNMPEDVRKRPLYQGLVGPKELGVFNTRYTGSITDNANGALIDIPIEDIENLRSREIGYDLRPVVCLKWPIDQNNPDFSIAYTLGCSGRTWKGNSLTDSTLLPHKKYLDLCKEGAQGLGDEFLNHFLQTSFLADGITSISEWENKLGGKNLG